MIIALAFICISNAVIKRTDKKRISEIADKHTEAEDIANTNPQPEKTPNEKLQELKQLYENELISKEEYEKKKAEILDKM